MPLIVHSTCRAPPLDARQGVGDRETQVVVAMDREHRLVGVRHALTHIREHVAVLGGRGVAHRVGEIDRRGAGLDRRLDAAAQIIEGRARRVHGRPFHVLHEVAGLGHGLQDDVDDLVLALAHLVREVDRRGRHEGVDPRPLGMAHRLAGPGDVGGNRAGEPRDGGALGPPGDLRHGLEIAVRRDGKAGLDDVDAHRIEQLGHRELLVEGHGGAGALLAVAQRGVEDYDAVAGGGGVRRGHGITLSRAARLEMARRGVVPSRADSRMEELP